MKQTFSKFDVDKNNSISSGELKQLLKDLQLDSKSRDVKSLMRQFDANGDGALQYEEFVQLWTSIGGKLPKNCHK